MIRNIIFDVGYVLVTYTWRDLFPRFGLGSAQIDDLAARIFDSAATGHAWADYDDGNITLEELEQTYEREFPAEYLEAVRWFLHSPDEWFEYLPDMCGALEEMKQRGFNIYLLSNYPKECWESHVLRAPFYPLVSGAVVSCEEHFGKPDRRFYETLLARFGLDAEECLFLDDRADNTAGAEEAGIRSLTIDTPARRQEAIAYLKSLPAPQGSVAEGGAAR